MMKVRKSISFSVALVVALLAVGSASAFVLLSPPRTWDSPPTVIVDNRGQSSITDGDGGATATRNAVTSNAAWNGAGSGTVVNAAIGSVAGWQLGDGVPMLNFRDPEHVCNGNCLAATFTGFFSDRGDGTFRIDDADIVTNASKKLKWTSAGEPDHVPVGLRLQQRPGHHRSRRRSRPQRPLLGSLPSQGDPKNGETSRKSREVSREVSGAPSRESKHGAIRRRGAADSWARVRWVQSGPGKPGLRLPNRVNS
jgi:hypothetical protein